MKRLHVHVAVEDLAPAVAFYSKLFALAPVKREADYAKWQLDDPCVNFAISQRGADPGVEHLGIEVDTAEALDEVSARLASADAPVFDEGETVCCYARSEKNWITDPAGVPWEVFRTIGESAVYGSDGRRDNALSGGGAARPTPCCAPAEPQAADSCR